MSAIVTEKQSNMSWTITWKAAGRYPIVADRIYETLADAQAYVNDLAPTASAIPGLVLSVVNDSNERNNGIYYVQSIATSADVPGVLAKAGSGEGSITAGSYSEAVGLATAGNIGQIIYVTADSTFNNVEYSEGPYMVTGAGLLVKLGTTTASGDLSSDVAELQGAVEDLETNKVDKVEGSRLMTDTEANKLAGIEEGAQVNVIETVKVNGTALEVTDKAVDIIVPAAPFQSVAEGDKVLTLTEGVLSSTLSFGIDETAREDGKKYLYVKGINGVEIGTVDTADFVVDGMLESVAVKKDADGNDTTVLVFTWNADGGSKTTEIDFSKYVDVYKADGTTLTLDSATNTFSVKAEVFDAYGAAATALEDAKDYADQAEADAIDAAKTYTDEVAGAYAAEGVEASGLRKEIAERDAQVLTDAIDAAKAYTDEVAGTYAAEGVEALGLRKEIAERDAKVLTDAKTYADKAAKDYTDTQIGVYSSEGVEASGLRKEIAERDAQVLTDAKTYADKAEEDAINTAKDYTDTQIGVYSSEGVEASGLRKEIEDLSTSVSDTYIAKTSVSNSESLYFDESGIIEVRAITTSELDDLLK